MTEDLTQTASPEASQDAQPEAQTLPAAPSLKELQPAESRLLVQTYERNPLLFVRGEGVHLYDAEGNEYLDLLSGIGVCALGYNHPAITKAIREQSERLIHTSNLFFHEHTAELALRLTELTGLDRVFFCNSGTEAWEAALKLARAFATKQRAEGKHLGTRILALEHSFHGRTMGSVATTHKAKYREPFMPVMPDVDFVTFNDVADLRAKFSNEVCAIAIEPIQGEGGINPVSPEFLKTARELCDSTGALLLFDEIQAGMGRTGKWCSYQHTDIFPDVTTLAKPLANGIPMGAMLCTDRAAAAFSPGMHGTTFGGNPLACAVAIALIDTIKRDNILALVEEVGSYFFAQLHALKAKHPAIVDIRGKGLMVGVDLANEDLAKTIFKGLQEHRILLNRTHETVLRFLPPFVITKTHIDRTITTLDTLLTEATHSNHTAAATK